MHLASQTHISLYQHWAVIEQISFAEVLQMTAELFEMALPNAGVCHALTRGLVKCPAFAAAC